MSSAPRPLDRLIPRPLLDATGCDWLARMVSIHDLRYHSSILTVALQWTTVDYPYPVPVAYRQRCAGC
jgi:hypothetical protein